MSKDEWLKTFEDTLSDYEESNPDVPYQVAYNRVVDGVQDKYLDRLADRIDAARQARKDEW